jgi:hypothetical protein
MFSGWVGICCALLAVAPKNSNNPHLPTALGQMRAFQEAEALQTLDEAKRWPYNTESELALVNLYFGIVYAELSRPADARRHFSLARVLDPSLTFPDEWSPSIRALWEETSPTPLSSARAVAELTPETSPPPAGVQTRPPPVEPSSTSPRSHWRRWAGVSLLGAAVVALVAAGFSGRASLVEFDRSRGEPRVDESLRLHESGATAARTANVLFGVSALLGAGGGSLFAVSF